ncbi:MAG: hypothetical protein FWF38_01080 [Spirochaetaceae bacterium]|nr:hypothetical protein [Spirochaetaceae bacterium]
MKRLFLLVIFIILTVSAWSLDFMAIVNRATPYVLLRPSVPKEADADGITWANRVKDKNGKTNYVEQWYFAANNNGVFAIQFVVYDKDKNKLNSTFKDMERQAVDNGFIINRNYSTDEGTAYQKEGILFIFSKKTEGPLKPTEFNAEKNGVDGLYYQGIFITTIVVAMQW